MAKSRVKRLPGVPEFHNPGECEEYVRRANTEARDKRLASDAAKARARNAAKQMVALLATQTMDDYRDAVREPQPETPEPTR